MYLGVLGGAHREVYILSTLLSWQHTALVP